MGLRKRAQVAKDSLTTPCALGRKRERPGTAGSPQGPSDPGPSHLGQLVDPTGPLAWARVTPESYLTLRTIGPERDTPGSAVSTCGHSDLSPTGPGQLVDPTGPRSGTRVIRDSWLTSGAFGPGLDWSHPGQLVNPVCAHTKRKSPGKAIRHCGTSGTVQSHPGCWLKPRALGPGPE